MSRLFIYSKDVQKFTGKGEKVALKLLAQIRVRYNKARKDLITVAEFCEHTGLDLNLVITQLD